MGKRFIMAGGGTGGHVIPGIAVARVLRDRGHEPVFIGTERGFEAKLVPQAGFPIEWIRIGGMKGLGLGRKLAAVQQIPASVLRSGALLQSLGASAVFSMGGYVAAPVMMAALWRRVPVVVMEPNAMPGFTNRHMGRWVARALVSFEETAGCFPPGRTEITGLPVRREFFEVSPKPRGGPFTVLITGASQGSRTLNQAVEESWPLFRESGLPVRLIHQTGAKAYEEIAKRFQEYCSLGEVTPFIPDMPAAYAQADLVVCRSGAGTVTELAAAGKPSVLVPFPFATDDHQKKNAEAFERAGAARLVLDRDMNGRRLFQEVQTLASDREALRSMGESARRFAKPGAAERAADVLEEVARR